VKCSTGSPSLLKSEVGIGQVQLLSAVTVATRCFASLQRHPIQGALRERHPTKKLHHFLEQPQRPDPGRETQRSAAQIQVVHSIRHAWHNAAMAHLRKSHEHDSTNGAVPGGRSDKDASDNPIDPRTFGLAKAAYGVGETLDLLSIGRTSLYAAVKRGDFKRVKFGKKTLFYAADLASFLTKLGRLSEMDANRVSHAPGASKSTKRS